MTFTRTELLDALDTVISIPLIPFAAGRIDYEGQRRNVDYLMRNNHLSGARPRVIALAGTSLINHIRPQEQLRLLDVTGQQMGGEGLLMAALVPNPLAVAGDLIDELAQLSRPPDVYLLMPLAGTFSPEGLYQQLLEFTACYGERHGARFLYYYRSPRDCEQILRLLRDSPHVVGVKIGTDVADVPAFVAGVGADALSSGAWAIAQRRRRNLARVATPPASTSSSRAPRTPSTTRNAAVISTRRAKSRRSSTRWSSYAS